MSYLAVKHLHIACAALSGSFFALRGIWMLRASALLQRRWVKIAPHIVDTVLLASALTLALWSGQYPFRQDWLSAKLLALLLYIALGTVALKRGRTARGRAAALAAALAVFAYIVAVALSRQVLPFI
ncbi:MAG: SirB2 family protein [Burkholderiales bacterium]|nr:SirB2 family protein [Burkholderiales bacterium]